MTIFSLAFKGVDERSSRRRTPGSRLRGASQIGGSSYRFKYLDACSADIEHRGATIREDLRSGISQWIVASPLLPPCAIRMRPSTGRPVDCPFVGELHNTASLAIRRDAVGGCLLRLVAAVIKRRQRSFCLLRRLVQHHHTDGCLAHGLQGHQRAIVR